MYTIVFNEYDIRLKLTEWFFSDTLFYFVAIFIKNDSEWKPKGNLLKDEVSFKPVLGYKGTKEKHKISSELQLYSTMKLTLISE